MTAARKAAWTAWIIGIVLMFVALVRPAHGQVVYTIPQTVQAEPWTNQPCGSSTLNSGALQNVGQTQHQIYVSGFTGNYLEAVVQGTNDGSSYVTISDQAWISGSAASASLSASGAYTAIRVLVTCSPSSATFSLTYSGSPVTPNPPQGRPLQSQVEKSLFSGLSAGSNTSSFNIAPPYANLYGEILFEYIGSAGPANSEIQVGCANYALISSGTQYYTYAIPITTAGTFQVFQVPSLTCPNASVQYLSGGSSTGTVELEYLFQSPGIQPTANAQILSSPVNLDASITEKGARWSVVSAPAAGSQASASQAALNLTYHVADCVSYSFGAIAAPTATKLTLNLRNGATGAGTIIWTKTIEVPATPGMHADGSFCGLNLIGSAATAMTLEASAGLANESESVSLTGYDVQ